MHLAPHSSYQTKAISPALLYRCLMKIRRAYPVSRLAQDAFSEVSISHGIIGDPSLFEELLA